MVQSEKFTSLNHVLSENSMVLVFFSGDHCSVCHALEPKIKSFVETSFPDIHFITIQTNLNPELASGYSVFSVPVILLFIEGKEYIREAGVVDIFLFKQKLNKIISLFKG
jgi:thioredoxin 1